MDFLTVGRIIKTVGLKGELKIFPTTSFSFMRFKKGAILYIEANGEYRKVTVETKRAKDKFIILKFNELNDINEAEKYLGNFLLAEKDYSLLKKDEYFYEDLLNCTVYFDNGALIGLVYKIEEYGPYVTLRIKTNKKDVLIPFVEQYLSNVDIASKKIVINYIEGLV